MDRLEKGTTLASSGFSPELEAQDRIQGNVLLSSRIRELEKELADQKKDQNTVEADRVIFFKKHHE